jgi:hypothetical protein
MLGGSPTIFINLRNWFVTFLYYTEEISRNAFTHRGRGEAFGTKLWASLKDRCPNASPLQGYIHFQKSPEMRSASANRKS